MTTFPIVERTGDDAPGFADSIDHVIAGLVFRYRPELVCVVRIQRWFDHRWLGFSGKGRIFFDPPWPSHVGVALDEFHQEQLTFPPFAPTRVGAEHHWERTREGNYVRAPGRFEIHCAERKHSSANLQRRVADLADSALYVWFSSTSASAQRGSVMVYVVNAGTTIPWFVAIEQRADAWVLGDVKGLGRAEVRELLEHPPGVR
jgi:hypothetical protein